MDMCTSIIGVYKLLYKNRIHTDQYICIECNVSLRTNFVVYYFQIPEYFWKLK